MLLVMSLSDDSELEVESKLLLHSSSDDFELDELSSESDSELLPCRIYIK